MRSLQGSHAFAVILYWFIACKRSAKAWHPTVRDFAVAAALARPPPLSHEVAQSVRRQRFQPAAEAQRRVVDEALQLCCQLCQDILCDILLEFPLAAPPEDLGAVALHEFPPRL